MGNQEKNKIVLLTDFGSSFLVFPCRINTDAVIEKNNCAPIQKIKTSESSNPSDEKNSSKIIAENQNKPRIIGTQDKI